MQHPQEPEGLIKSYLPVNIGSEKAHKRNGGHQLVRIDPELFDELARKPWHTRVNGRVYRRQLNAEQSGLQCRHIQDRIMLVKLVSGNAEAVPMNGDWLDMRRANLWVPTAHVTILGESKPGSSFANDEQYREAMLRRPATVDWLNEHVITRTRGTKLTQAQVRQFLDDLQVQPYLKNATLEIMRQEIETAFGVEVSLTECSQIVRGKKYRVPGYDYAKVLKARPTRGQLNSIRAEERRLAA